MYLLGTLLEAVAFILESFLSFFILLVIVRAILSWVNPDPFNPIVRFLTSSTDPLLSYVKRVMPRIDSPIDFSPLVLLVLLYALKIVLVKPLYHYASKLQMETLVTSMLQ